MCKLSATTAARPTVSADTAAEPDLERLASIGFKISVVSFDRLPENNASSAGYITCYGDGTSVNKNLITNELRNRFCSQRPGWFRRGVTYVSTQLIPGLPADSKIRMEAYMLSPDVDWYFDGSVCALLLDRIRDFCKPEYKHTFYGGEHLFGRENGIGGWPRNGRLNIRYDPKRENGR